MEDKQVSSTALVMAYFRGYHAVHDSPKIFDDFLAYRLLTVEERKAYDQQFASFIKILDPVAAASCPDQAAALAWFVQSNALTPLALSRARYTENKLEEVVRQGVTQYVILGAGFDTFAFRRSEMLEQLHVFEVDHPATQAYKRQRLKELGWEHPAQLHFVPVDFTHENLVDALNHSSYNPQAPTFFSWLGVTYYLPRDTVFAILRIIANNAPTGSMVLFDYLDSDAFVPEKAAPRVQAMLRAAQQVGEPMQAGFDPSTIAADLAPLGLRLYEGLSPSDIQRCYFQGRTDGYSATEHAHFICAVVE